jgi:GntR family transcriptional regulator, transcriptional repressor for pyruvate dehydrogenase complex
MMQIAPLGVTDAIIKKFQELIRSGQLSPEERLPNELELAKQMNASRASVREALKALSVLGLLQRTKHGTYIRPDALQRLAPSSGELHTIFDAQHVYEARRLLEPGIAALAAKRATPSDRQAMGECLARMRASSEDRDAFIQADFDFHRAMGQASQNPVLSRLLETLLHTLTSSHGQLGRIPHLAARAVEHHRRLLEAMTRGNAEGARRLSAQNLATIERMYLAHLGTVSAANRRP